MSLLDINNFRKVQYTWLQRFAGNIIRYGCTSLPRHIAIIMDGNRRFASDHNLERIRGHVSGLEKLVDVSQWFYDLGINELSIYAWSIENFRRPQDEVNESVTLLRSKLNEIDKLLDVCQKHQICIRIVGNLDLAPEDIRQAGYRVMNETNHYKKFVINAYVCYTSRNEITNTIKDLAKGCEKDLINIDDIDDDLIIQSLAVSAGQTGHFPDICIRTSGEIRVSDFMLLQCRFSMWTFLDVNWPAFSIWHLYWIILQYEVKSKELLNLQDQCQNIIKQDKTNNEQRNKRIKTYLNWLEQERIRRIQL